MIYLREAYMWISHLMDVVLSNSILAWILPLILHTLKKRTAQTTPKTIAMSSLNSSLRGTRSVRKPGLEAL
ncbi:hypothetical protein YC2023_016438 [Brassica napus]